MKKKGELLICDRCGEQVFIEVKIIDCDVHYPMPEGWYYSGDLGMHLCPECSAKYEQLILDFKEEGKVYG